MIPTAAPKPHLPGPPETQQELEQLASELMPWADGTPERLRALALAVGTGRDSAAWAGVNLHRAFEPDAVTERLQAGSAPPGWTRWLETIRNVLILVPVLVTWYGISEAVSAYHALVAHSIATATTRAALPFLYLWESGFDGRLPAWLTLSRVALYDSILILLVLTLTLLVYVSTSLTSGRGHAAAADLSRRLRLALGDAELHLATRRHPETLALSFVTTARELVEEIRTERQRLDRAAEAQELEVRELHKCTRTFAEGSQNVLAATGRLAELYGRSSDATARLDRSIDQLAESQRGLETAVASAGARLETLIRGQESQVAELRGGVGALTGATDALGQTVDRLASASECMAKTQSDLVEPLLGSVNRVETSTTLVHQASLELAAATAQQTASTRDQTTSQTALTAATRAAQEQTGVALSEQRRLNETIERVAGRMGALVDQHQALANSFATSLQRELSTLDRLSPQVESTAAIASRLAEAETNLLATITREHQTLEHVATVVGRAAMGLERTLERIQEHEQQIFGLAVDLHDLSTSLPDLSRRLHEDLAGLVSAHERAAVHLEEAGRQVAQSAGEVHRLVSQGAVGSDVRDGPSAPGDGFRETNDAADSSSS